jgi:hypothetical protein
VGYRYRTAWFFIELDPHVILYFGCNFSKIFRGAIFSAAIFYFCVEELLKRMIKKMRSERSLGLRYCSGLGAGKLDGVLCHSGGTAAFISLEEIRLVFCALSIIFDSKILKKNVPCV